MGAQCCDSRSTISQLRRLLPLTIGLCCMCTCFCNAQTTTASGETGVRQIDERALKASADLINRLSSSSPPASLTSGPTDQRLSEQYKSENKTSIIGLTHEQFEQFVQSISQRSENYNAKIEKPCDKDINCTRIPSCPSNEEIFQDFGSKDKLLPEGLVNALPVVLNTLTSPSCSNEAESEKDTPPSTTPSSNKEKKRPTTLQTWLYGIGCCTVVVIISNIGVCLGPFIQTRFFKRLLQFLVSMGAGSLASTGLLVLIPEAFDLMSAKELGDAYIWKALFAILSIFTFFCSERILKTFLFKRSLSKKGSLDKELHINSNGVDKDGGDGLGAELIKVSNGGPRVDPEGHGHSHSAASDALDRKSLAWMVMAGDVIHNFVDGLAVGAAFSENIGLGISVSLAIVCEELPHELADVAILLHSGLSIKMALFINFLSACFVYLGLLLGILVGGTIHSANQWIFALAGGLFLYVPLVDMLPDMSSHLDRMLQSGDSDARLVAFLQLIGLLVGTFIIVIIVNFSGCIHVD